MAGTKNGTGIARNLLIGLVGLLVVGVLGSTYMGFRARGAATKSVVDQATTIADRSLGLVFRPEDLSAPADAQRATDLDERITAVVLDPSSFDSVTLWSQDGQILYSTQGRIGNTLDDEKGRIGEALRGKAQTTDRDGTFSVTVPLQLRSGVGDPTAVEMTTSAATIDAAAGPWRTNALFLGVLLAIVGFALYRVNRTPHAASTAVPMRSAAQRIAPAAPAAAPTKPITVPSPGLREEGEARRQAEDRARAAEERLALLQDQYRKSLDDLRTAERRMHEQAVSARPDPRLQEQLEATQQQARDHEHKAREIEARFHALQEEHRELARLAPDPDVMAQANDRLVALKEQRDALRRERDALLTEREELSSQHADLAARLAEGMEPQDDPELMRRLEQAETEVIGLRAELDGAQTQLTMSRRELEAARTGAERAKELQEDLDAAHVETLHTQEGFEAARSELQSSRTELEDARAELRALRNEEQRAAMLVDELRAARAELESASASHRAELLEREAELEVKVRSTREEFQAQVAALESRHAEALAAQEADAESRSAAAQADTATEFERLQRELADRDERYGSAERAVAEANARAEDRSQELEQTKVELDSTVQQLSAETTSVRELAERAERAERETADTSARTARLASDLHDATQDNAELNRRLQEVEARRALELAEVEGRTDLDELLRVTQERLAGQTEKLIAAEDRVHRMERDVEAKLERLEEVEGELRHVQMSEAMRHIRGEDQEESPRDVSDVAPIEDRRATSPFIKELSLDARRSVTQILGLTQILKHKKDPKDQAQLVRQLTTSARRLDHVVTDMTDAESLIRGTVELTVRRTDLEALVNRVVEESGVDSDHEVRVETERVVVALDQLRTEQILAGLLRASADRTPPKKAITVRLSDHAGGALISVEDPEPSSDASLSPVVQRFAEVQGGWAKVESREEGGSAFRVFLPDGAKAPAGPAADAAPNADGTDDAGLRIADADAEELRIVVEDDEPDEPDWKQQSPEQLLVQELHRLSEITAED